MIAENISEREGLDRLESLFKEKNYKEASAFATDLHERFPSSFQIGFLYYRILVNLESYSESESILDELLKLYPENINLLLEKGDLLIGRGKTAESKLFFDKVLFLDPFNSKAKSGVDKIRGENSGSPSESGKYEKEKAVLEDTMRESDLERFMTGNSETDPVIEKGEEIDLEEELDINIAEDEMEFKTPLTEEGVTLDEVSNDLSEVNPVIENKVLDDDTGIPGEENNTEVQDENLKVSGKVELALEELDKFSRSDIDDLGFERQPDESDKETEKVEVVSSDDAFATESAAILYLKQGLYDEAKEIYGKLYRSLDEKIFMEKIGKVKRVEKANLKINALEEFLEKIKTGSVRIV
ncbi:MAG: hypothetical protein KAR14_09100 [Candidatus Aminicenantes bacterium]|nr:hypothetical protein [Candidatus Aminicenantes bacterium]